MIKYNELLFLSKWDYQSHEELYYLTLELKLTDFQIRISSWKICTVWPLSSLGFILTQLIQRLRYLYIGIYGFELLKTWRRTFPNKYKILNIEGKMYCHKEVNDIVYPRFLKSLTKTQQSLLLFYLQSYQSYFLQAHATWSTVGGIKK